MTYQLSKEAEKDIVSIYLQGIDLFGWGQADQYHDRLIQCFEFLADNPRAAPEIQEIVPPVRVHPLGAHLIVYQTLQPTGIHIIRVRHGREAWWL
jgi:toxin ParE1/3/4